MRPSLKQARAGPARAGSARPFSHSRQTVRVQAAADPLLLRVARGEGARRRPPPLLLLPARLRLRSGTATLLSGVALLALRMPLSLAAIGAPISIHRARSGP
jgi:hypothetical protein